MSRSAGYSGTPLPKKLGIADGHRLALVNPPGGFERTLGRLPAGVDLRRRLRGRADVIVCFVTSRVQLERRIDVLRRALEPDGGLWIAWPKKASGVPTDVTENVVREIGVARGLVDNKVCAIDGVWSGLRLVYRVSDRPYTAQSRGRGHKGA